jgi:hemerythrin superfamily protein
MDCLNLLIADHNRVRGLIKQFHDAHDADDSPKMAEVASKIASELKVHTAIEEEIFYPWAKAISEEIAEMVNEGVEEHHEIKVLLAETDGVIAPDPTWVAKWTVIIENVEHHAGEEESDLFPKVRGATSAEDRGGLGDRLDRRKGELGAPTLADTQDLTDDQLHELATAQSIPGRSSMKRDELAATVSPA